MKQLTTGQAIIFSQSKIWETWTDDQIVRLQLFQGKLCIPFGRFKAAITKVLCRPVYTHEFAFRQGLIKEYLSKKTAPTFEEIINLIPEDKRIILTQLK